MKLSMTFKYSFLVMVVGLLSASMSAQESVNKVLFYKGTSDTIRVGDTVSISRDCKRYETTERIIHWAFDKKHVVRQVNSKFHPDAILLKHIYSWIPADAAVLISRPIEIVDTTIITLDTIATDTIRYPGSDSLRIDYTIVKCVHYLSTLKEVQCDTTVFTKICDTCGRSQDNNPPLKGQIDRFTLAFRGGFASTVAQPFVWPNIPLGHSERVDLQYAHYWPTAAKKCHLGLMFGASAGYMIVNRQQVWNNRFEMVDEYGDILQYNITADIQEATQQWQVEVPLMLSVLGEKGFYFNVGPRFLLPIYSRTDQVIGNGNIEVTDQSVGVTLQNNLIYGQLSADPIQFSSVNNMKYSWTILCSFEMGGEIKLGNSDHSLGLGVYANLGVYNAHYGLYDFKWHQEQEEPITVTPPTSSSIAIVDVKPLSTTLFGHLDVGVKLSFNFDFKK